jgi:hypothetical protein
MSSSKRAHRRRVRTAQHERYLRLRKSGRLPVHTPAELRLARAERERERLADGRRGRRLRLVTKPTVVGVAAVSFGLAPAASASTSPEPMFQASAYIGYTPGRDLPPVSLYYQSHQNRPYEPYALPGASSPDRSEPPHPPEPEMTFYTGWDGAGTATPRVGIGPFPAGIWNDQEWPD